MLGTRETIRASEGLLPKGLTIWVDPDYLGRLAKPLINQHKASSQNPADTSEVGYPTKTTTGVKPGYITGV